MHAYISEIFNSVQGEGPYVGVRQVFVRFEECQLRCIYCDTPQTRNISEFCRVEKNPGKGDFISVKNPLSKEELGEIIQQLWSLSTEHVSLTGGEPLIHADFINTLDLEYQIYLETNSGFPEKARQIKDSIAIASCDIKLPEHYSTENYGELLKNELETIAVFNETSKTFAKIVVLPETTTQSISPAVDGLASIDRNIPFILQPVTERIRQVPPELLFELMDFAGKKLKHVRVIPQTHKIMGFL